MKNTNYFYPLLLCVLLSCESSTEIIYEPTELTLTILDDTGVALKGAQVRVFDNEEELNNFKTNGQLEDEFENLLSDEEGHVVLSDLDEKLRYYFFVTYRDRNRFVDLENFNREYVFPGYLKKGSKTTAQIQLEKSDNVVVFYSLPINETQLPITLYLDGDSVAAIDRTVEEVPSSPNVTGTFVFRLREGLTKWYGVSRLGCLWTGQFSLGADDNFTSQEFQQCQSGSVTFWTEDDNDAMLPLTISLGDGDQFGKLYTSSNEPATCFSTTGVSGSRQSGTYRYIAESLDKNCIWTGEFTLTEGDCIQVKLDKCF
jgi:hypothetical protein